MIKSTLFVGIDISKDVFDVYFSEEGHRQFTNDVSGFKSFTKGLTQSHWCVMEATACYHYQLALYLFKKGIQVSVMNPLVIKRFKQMELLIKTHEPELFTIIKSIPGIGKKTAMLLIITTNSFKDFESCRQISSFLGLAPNERSSGSSVRGRSRISKTGNPIVRNHLFLCSFTASVHNPQCKALYDRIVAKGKSKKLALIAVCNKLIKQAYGISKSGIPYDKNYVSKLC
jgi:transposase